MNIITHEDFGVFQTEFLNVDFITFNLNKLSDSQIYQLAVYFQSLGFNCYQKDSEKSKSRQEFYNNNRSQNQFELDFILNVLYQKEIMQIQFPGLSANQFYQFIKRKSIQWENLTKFDIILSRFDLVYERINKSTDKIDTREFLNSSYIQFQKSHPNRKLASEKNQKGLILKIGNRKGLRHYRIYTRNNSLRIDRSKRGPANHKAFLTREGKKIVEDRKKDFEFLFLMKNPDSYIFTSESNHDQMLSRETITKDVNRVMRSVSKSLPD